MVLEIFLTTALELAGDAVVLLGETCLLDLHEAGLFDVRGSLKPEVLEVGKPLGLVLCLLTVKKDGAVGASFDGGQGHGVQRPGAGEKRAEKKIRTRCL